MSFQLTKPKPQTTLRQLRRLHRLTQDEVAQQTGIDRTDLSRIERGYKIPNDEQLEKLAAAVYSSDPSELLQPVP